MSMVEASDVFCRESDHAALYAACRPGVALCTVVAIDGSFSRRLGSQLAVMADGSTVGSLADGCLERQLANDVRRLRRREVRRFGRGSGQIDFRLPCGGALDILLDPNPDRADCRAAVSALEARSVGTLALPAPSPLEARRYLPSLRLRIFGEGPEVAALETVARATGIEVEAVGTEQLSLGRPSALPRADRWTAIVLLFHDHEWELALIEEAFASAAFYVGAQGGESARTARTLELLSRGVGEDELVRLHSPIGLLQSCKSPQALALSTLTEIVGAYELMCDGH